MLIFKNQSTNNTTNQILEFFRAVISNIPNEFAKYIVASGAALAVDVGFLYLLTDIFGIHYLFSATISFSLGILCVYLLSISWVFDKRRLSDNRIELLVFAFIGIVGLGINALGLYLLTGMAGFFYLYSKAFTIILVFSWNFGARKIALFS
jgi:putative flippase GtrA